MRRNDCPRWTGICSWKAQIAARPSTVRAYSKGKAVNTAPVVTKELASILFGQKAAR